ncbi:conserved hypothetical protein [Leptospira interrogans serovar Manilae]|uniref:Uncharacterized protein n=1 Tax=Leptospira interrogans serovar Manilae TaxID=214675 RepID=A0AAQ1SPI3_LEPIR|nr:hypothetical protein [Leptospira interrogans]AKP25299.1 hypothetical protein LIMLP_04610 [Leptospira interrogans serovar Manilae]AKP29083.1 hypothetical protein LIMHP_04595 [Leptospira interrogans serovar Manilae]EYU62992.1 hypothetical protein CI00_17075 [Leptospira interrogans serovar Manilae]SOR62648.1 conserved hypothetical protein [Leptospira interrogans serovar Manilae]
MKKYILIFLTVLILFCQNEDKKNNQDLIRLLANTFNETRSDCVYCTDTQAFQGSCSCFSNIPIWSCQGYSSGRQKSNSIRISCEDLTSKGVWFEDSDNQGAKSCTFLSCPPEAYRAAFTPDGF